VTADYQEQGRGRLGRFWHAPSKTCLLASYIVPLSRTETAAQLGMTAAVAVADALASVCGLEANLKWPNDVLVNDRKIAGVLVEIAAGPPAAYAGIVGIGVNLNMDSLPVELEQTATSARIEGRSVTDVDSIEHAVRTGLFRMTGEMEREGFAGVLSQWRLRDATAGRIYRGSGEPGTSGVAVGVGDTGALCLRLADNRIVEVISATSTE
jgi:BirA family biotin operon repressor/biotin-[acetyl-CoA-carboxylase] ligase